VSSCGAEPDQVRMTAFIASRGRKPLQDDGHYGRQESDHGLLVTVVPTEPGILDQVRRGLARASLGAAACDFRTGCLTVLTVASTDI
jgi:hypothetical protein